MGRGGAIDVATPPARRALGEINENEALGGEPATPAPLLVAFAEPSSAGRPSIVSSASPLDEASGFARRTLPRRGLTLARDGDHGGYGSAIDDAARRHKTPRIERAPSVAASRAFRDDACGMELDMDWDGDW